jgi:pimeloyl-ACP methyl ester carboxylesterase
MEDEARMSYACRWNVMVRQFDPLSERCLELAYQVMGEGPLCTTCIFLSLIRFDKRGTGLSDRLSAIPTLEERMDDVRAVMDAAGSTRAALLGFSEGGPMCIVFAATYPQRTLALILYGAFARQAWAPDNPWGTTDEEIAARVKSREENWGQGKSLDRFSPSLAGDEELRKFVGRSERASASPGAAETLVRMSHGIDVRHVLPTIGVPTLVLHRTGDIPVNVENGRYLARHIIGDQVCGVPENRS